MFYPVESLKRGGRFYLCWVADSWPLRFATITHRQLWSQDVCVLCDDLMEVMNRESGYASTRFSLRLSSQLMRGLVRLYQRKVAVFLGDLCMLNATVIKHTNKKWSPHEKVRHPRTPRRAIVVEEVPGVEERVEERIQESGNVVANIEQITLKEAAVPEVQVTTIVSELHWLKDLYEKIKLSDGFGEENPEQALQMLNDQTLEQMLVQDDRSVLRLSGPYQPMLDSIENSHDKSRMHPHDAIQTERISEINFTMKSTAIDDPSLTQMDLEKDILQTPDNPIPNQSVLPPEKEVLPEEPAKEKTPEPHVIEAAIPTETEKEKEPPVEFELEEIEDAEPKRKRPKRLIIDKKIKTTGNAFRQRLECVNVELRCEDSSEDIIDALFVPAEQYLRRPSSVGWRMHARLGHTLTGMFLRNLGIVEPQKDDKEIEQMLGTKPRKTRRTVEKEGSKTPPIPVVSDQQPSVIVDAPLQQVDLSDMPTQLLLMSQEAQKRSYDVEDLEDAAAAKRPCRRSGYVSFRKSQQLDEQFVVEEQQMLEKEVHLSITTTPKKPRNAREEIPQMLVDEPALELRESQMNEQDREKHVSQLLEAAGLADAANVPTSDSAPRVSQNKTQSKVGDGSSETPLGSLDRTRVDVGESVKTTDTQRFLRTEWGTQGTMLKVVKLLNKGRHPLTVRVLVENGPISQPNLERFVAARCFTSLLKLKQHRFIKLQKDVSTLEVTDILCGSKIKM